MDARAKATLRAAAVASSLFGPIGGAWASDPVTIPASARDVEGNSDNLYPFNGNPIRYQQVVAASEFPPGPRTIARLAFRADAASGAAFAEGLGYVRIRLTTSPKAPGTLSRTFAENLGADTATVFDGSLALSSTFDGPAAGPKAMDLMVRLDVPFTYDPAAGCLLIDIQNFSGGRTTQLDAHDAPVSTARVWSDDVESETARPGDPFPASGLVIRFLSD